SLSIALAIIIVAYILFSLLRRHRTCTLFPYTTLFRSGEDKGLIVSATGTGKTYLSAFDVKQFNPERVLFVAHREQILQKSLQDYRDLIDMEPQHFGIYSGTSKNKDAKYLFATVQTLSREDHLQQFKRDDFDYIVIDE